MALHGIDNPPAQVAVHQQIVGKVEERHVGGANTVDNSVAALRGISHRSFIKNAAFQYLNSCDIGLKAVAVAQQHPHTVPLVDKAAQYIVPQQAGSSEQQHSHVFNNALSSLILRTDATFPFTKNL